MLHRNNINIGQLERHFTRKPGTEDDSLHPYAYGITSRHADMDMCAVWEVLKLCWHGCIVQPINSAMGTGCITPDRIDDQVRS